MTATPAPGGKTVENPVHGAAAEALVAEFGDPSVAATATAIGSMRVRLESGKAC